MAKYRGFEKELPKLSGLGAAFSGPRISEPAPAPYVAPAPAYVPTISTGLIDPAKIQAGIPGDIRDITARSQPGEAIADDMAAENGVPGVDESGTFPYGTPKGGAGTATEKAGGNAGWIIAAVLATLLLGG